MVEFQLVGRGIRDARVLAAMRQVPREAFVASGLADLAYEDAPLPIAEGQTISQPFIVALMAEAAEIKARDRVLEVGTGSGYAAAVISRIAAKVFTIERYPALAQGAEARLREFGYDNIAVRTGDGTLGWPEEAPFDAILVTAGGPDAPPALKRQLAIGGRLIVPVGPGEREQRLLKLVRRGDDAFERKDLGGVLFVPLIGEQGWIESEVLARRRR
ncbi:protein-L-isoaspartate O-methyltransferase [Bosea thiooxidans]|nr:protein-L-isoaspartate O-methyltransferase [Bosea thiooxidans]